MDEEEVIFEQLTLSDFKMWSSTVLKSCNNYDVILANNTDNMRVS